jgi:hypothetical protein
VQAILRPLTSAVRYPLLHGAPVGGSFAATVELMLALGIVAVVVLALVWRR